MSTQTAAPAVQQPPINPAAEPPKKSDPEAVKQALDVMFGSEEPGTKPAPQPKVEATPPKEEAKTTAAPEVKTTAAPEVPTEEPEVRGAPVNVPPPLLSGLDVPSGLGKKDTALLKTLALMEQQDKQYAGIADKTIKFWADEESYKAKWEKTNPGAKFNPDDEEHEEFYKNEPQFNQDDFDAAKSDVAKYEATREMRIEQAERADDEAEVTRHKKESPTIAKAAKAGVAKLITDVSPELGKLVGGELTDETWAKLEDEDPAAAVVLKREGEYLQRKLEEFERLNRYQRTYRPDPKNRLHQDIARVIMDSEDKIASGPKEEQLFNGKQFVPQAEYHRMAWEIHQTLKGAERKAALKKLDETHWMLQPDDVKDIIIAEHKRRSAQKIKQARTIEDLVKKKHGISASQATRAAASQQAAPAPAVKPKPDFGPSSLAGGTAPVRPQGPAKGASALETLESLDR